MCGTMQVNEVFKKNLYIIMMHIYKSRLMNTYINQMLYKI